MNTADTYLQFLNLRLANLADAKSKLAESVAKDPLYALSWAENAAVELALGECYELVKAQADKSGDVLKARDNVVARMTQVLLDNTLRGGSSSAFSNAVDAAKREAASRFVRENS